MATDTPQLSSGQHVDTRDFRVISVALIGSDGTSKEIAPMVAEIQIRQDLYLGFMSGELLINDGVDLISQTGMHGGEYILIHMKVPEQKIELKKAFRIYKLGNRSMHENAQRYTLFFMSDELFVSNTKKISKAYKNSTVSNIAYDIMKTNLKIPTNRIFVDPTTETTSIIIPQWKPSEALNWLASRAYTDSLTAFFFYENFEGFFFRSLQTMYKKGTVIKVPFTLENKKVSRDLDMDKFAIDDYETKRDFDILSTINTGGYVMRLLDLNLITQKSTNHNYSINKVDKIYKNPPMSDAGDLFSKNMACFRMTLTGSASQNWIKRDMHLAALNSSLTELVVPGNMGLNVGTLVSIRVPYTVTPAEGDMWDKRKSGKYLCVAVNHKFDMVNHKFTSLVLLARDSQPESLPATDNTLPKKIAKINT